MSNTVWKVWVAWEWLVASLCAEEVYLGEDPFSIESGRIDPECYHLATDQTETTDVAAARLGLTEKLAARWREWADRTGVEIP